MDFSILELRINAYCSFSWVLQSLFKLQGDLRLQKADLIEKEVRDTLIEYYKEKKEEAVVMINGIEMLILDGAKGQKQEVDFLIINYSR